MREFSFITDRVGRWLLSSAAGLALAACSAEDPPVRDLSSPYPSDPQVCDEKRADGPLYELIYAGDTEAMRCFLAFRDAEPDSFNLRYLMYRLEGVEPEGLDELVRGHDRLRPAARIANIHGRHDTLEDIPFRGGCTGFDAPARELLSRTPPQDEVKGCRRWGL
jgi:hypothetical protein